MITSFTAKNWTSFQGATGNINKLFSGQYIKYIIPVFIEDLTVF